MASSRGVIILCVLHLCVQSIEGEVKPAIPDDKFLEQNQQNMATATKDTVWIGFMDIVPVIGTVKESVELVLALYEGNEAVIKEKEKAIENFVKESFKKHVKKATLPDKPTPAAAEFSGLRNVTEVKKEMIIEHARKHSKREKKALTEAQRRERLRAIENDMVKKIRKIKPGFHQVLVESTERSQRGEHVFNNNILKFHSKVLSLFIEKHSIKNLPRYNQYAIDRLSGHTLRPDTATDIGTNMVAHFGVDEFYVNANAVMYGEYSRALREAMLALLDNKRLSKMTMKQIARVKKVIKYMNEYEIYVDQLAKVKWIDNRANRQARFEQVKQQVAHMYKTNRGYDWCKDILRLVAPWLGYKQ